MEMNEIKNIIENNATERKLYEKRLYETMSSLDILKTEKRKLENSVLLDITQEKNEDGKPIYTNEKMRESEQNKRLAHNTAYIEILTKETELNKEISDLKIEIDFLRRKFKSVELYLDYLKVGGDE